MRSAHTSRCSTSPAGFGGGDTCHDPNNSLVLFVCEGSPLYATGEVMCTLCAKELTARIDEEDAELHAERLSEMRAETRAENARTAAWFGDEAEAA